jgi:hypothetical protein
MQTIPWIRLSVRALPLAALLCAIGCSDADVLSPTGEPGLLPAPGSLLAEPLAPFPETFSEVGLYPFAPDLERVPPGALLYEPAWPLYSNGSSKARYLVLPEGERIDNSMVPWVFPVGTLLFKTFSFEEPGWARVAETRVLRRAADDWEYAAYLWRDGGGEADLLALKNQVPVGIAAPEPFPHLVPNRLQCRKCHESAPTRVLGFSELALSEPPAGGGPTQLEIFAAAGLFSSAPPAAPERIEHPDATTRQVLGYLEGNCTHCHNGGSEANPAFDLQHTVALENIIDHPTESSASAAGIRVVPGAPEESILFLAFSGEGTDPEIKAMPPLGVERRDAAAVELLRTWIESLPH